MISFRTRFLCTGLKSTCCNHLIDNLECIIVIKLPHRHLVVTVNMTCVLIQSANKYLRFVFFCILVQGLGSVPLQFTHSLISADHLSASGHRALSRTRSEPLPQNPKTLQQQLLFQQQYAAYPSYAKWVNKVRTGNIFAVYKYKVKLVCKTLCEDHSQLKLWFLT